ncbi:hypothetical protein SAMN05661080_04600 [Modestobacter sp. DSM 44400]|nr:hypothetical protein [Modestobacter sp. DSM 44400]SDY78466.1 hypothetical protein SAMN05661080_04600 [Modestobacter sp. DSM 44400]
MHGPAGAEQLDGVVLDDLHTAIGKRRALRIVAFESPAVGDDADLGGPVQQLQGEPRDVLAPAEDRHALPARVEPVAGRAVQHVRAVVLLENFDAVVLLKNFDAVVLLENLDLREHVPHPGGQDDAAGQQRPRGVGELYPEQVGLDPGHRRDGARRQSHGGVAVQVMPRPDQQRLRIGGVVGQHSVDPLDPAVALLTSVDDRGVAPVAAQPGRGALSPAVPPPITRASWSARLSSLMLLLVGASGRSCGHRGSAV